MDKSKQASLVYDKIAEPYAKEFLKPSEYIDRFITFLPKNGKILDVGCGCGIDANYLTSKGFQVTGVDLSKGMLKLAKQKFPHIHFKHKDIRKSYFPYNSLDGILASCSLIHIPKKDIPNLLKKFSYTLKKEGVIYLELQEGESKEIFIDEPFKPDEKLFVNVMSLKEISSLLTQHGFSIIENYERKHNSKGELNFDKRFIIAKRQNEYSD